jgi:phospholipase/carboxylesterase
MAPFLLRALRFGAKALSGLRRGAALTAISAVSTVGSMDIDPSAVIWNRDDREGRPLLLVLHGLGASEHDLLPLVPALPAELAIGSVRAPIAFPPGWSWFPPEQTAELPQQVDDAADAVIRFVEAQPPHPTVGVLGFSQGGAIAVHVLRRRPELLDYAVSLAGFLPGAADDAALGARRPPLFAGYGLADEVVPPEWNTMLVDWARPLTALEERTYPGLPHAVSEQEIADAAAFIGAHAG